jgi:hypothetical protein
MRDLIGEGGGVNRQDLSQRMAENVIEATVTYLSAPGLATAEQVTTLSAALQSLATLAIAEQLQTLVAELEQGDGEEEVSW